MKVIDGADKVTGVNGRTDPTGTDRLIARLRKSDTVGIEAGYPAFVIARQILEQTGCEVVILNPVKLAVIHASLKKTDKEDALKLARLVKRFPREELPEVSLPSQEEEHCRALMSEQGFLKKERTRLVNRLHSIYLRAGLTTVSKKDLKGDKSRLKMLERLGSHEKIEARRLNCVLNSIEEQVKEINDEFKERLKSNEDAPLLMSIPGVGPIMAMTFLAYMGDGSWFSNAAQVSHYTGLIPRGDARRYVAWLCRRPGPLCVAATGVLFRISSMS